MKDLPFDSILIVFCCLFLQPGFATMSRQVLVNCFSAQPRVLQGTPSQLADAAFFPGDAFQHVQKLCAVEDGLEALAAPPFVPTVR